jgi:predicted GNAT superfamily acetyltransferase
MEVSPVGQAADARPIRSAGTSRADSGIVIRPIVSLDELVACVALQNRVWGEGFSEAVPVSLLKAASYVGGLTIGAFSPDGMLLGFVFGLTGIAEGRTVHWSHLLGVLDTARNLGLGRMLKEYQRTELARQGIPEMRWTFDPLIARNAHLNLNLLGARVVRFTPNMYGTNATPLHHGLPTDRFVVSCATTADPHSTAMPRRVVTASPVLAFDATSSKEANVVRRSRAPVIRLEIPSDFQQLASAAPDLAADVQASVRANLLWALENGYAVDGLHRDAVSSRAFYVLTSASTPS